MLLGGEDVTRDPAHRRALRGLVRTFQITSVFPELTALANVAYAEQARAGHSFRFWRRADGDAALDGPGGRATCTVWVWVRARTSAPPPSRTAERRQLEIAMALACAPRVLLLDEPMAGMGPEESAMMVRLLDSLRGGRHDPAGWSTTWTRCSRWPTGCRCSCTGGSSRAEIPKR